MSIDPQTLRTMAEDKAATRLARETAIRENTFKHRMEWMTELSVNLLPRFASNLGVRALEHRPVPLDGVVKAMARRGHNALLFLDLEVKFRRLDYVLTPPVDPQILRNEEAALYDVFLEAMRFFPKFLERRGVHGFQVKNQFALGDRALISTKLEADWIGFAPYIAWNAEGEALNGAAIEIADHFENFPGVFRRRNGSVFSGWVHRTEFEKD